jgi:uroporphyrinogen-III synthase
MRILLTRPELQGERTAAALRARGHDVIHSPLLRIETIADANIGNGPWTAVAMTSANAAHAISTHRRKGELLGLPVFVVGERTQEAARSAGFANVQAAQGGVDELAELIVARSATKAAILYLAGEDRAGDLGGALKAAGYSVSVAVVYRAVAETALSPIVVGALKADAIGAVLHFSPRSAVTFAELAVAMVGPLNTLNCKHFCLSSAVAEPLAAAGARQVFVATHPREAAMLQLIGND